MERKVNRFIEGRLTVDGAGVRLNRVFGYDEIPLFDPFLMMDFFDSTNPDDYIKGFPWHPHRGIETVTYLVHGKINHGDSIGNSGTITDGDCQWMTAGSGIIHQEMPQARPETLGVQIWINLPKKEKMCIPKYRDFTSDKVPVLNYKDLEVRVIAGEYSGVKGPLEVTRTQVSFFDIKLKAGSEFTTSTPHDFNAYAFLIRGEAVFDQSRGFSNRYPVCVLYDAGDMIRIKTEESSARFLLLTGKKIKEPIAWGGPVVMNEDEELKLAFEELEKGTFIKQK